MPLQRITARFHQISLKNKMFFSSLAVILLLSFAIALLTRWILISSLTAQLKQSGLATARGIAARSRELIARGDRRQLENLIRDLRHEQNAYSDPLIAYVVITDNQHAVLAHTFPGDVPQSRLPLKRRYRPDRDEPPIPLAGKLVFALGVPVISGHHQIATVHLGVNKQQIDILIGKLRTTFIGFLSVIAILFFAISHRLSRYITRPITRLTEIANKITRGEPDMTFTAADLHAPPSGGPHRAHPKQALSSVTSPEVAPRTTPHIDTKDEVMQLAHSFFNMTSRLKRSQDEVQASEAKYRSLFASGPNPIFVLDRGTLEILDINPSAVEVYGLSQAADMGKSFQEMGRFEYEDRDLLELAHSGWPEDFVLRQNARYYQADGKLPLYIRIKACPTRYNDRDAVVMAATNITEMVEKEAQLIQASKMSSLGEMSAGMAHELNQPLNAIKLGSQFLSTMVDSGSQIPPTDLKLTADEIARQVDRAAEIINRLRQFGRKTDFTKDKVNLNDPIRAVLGMIGRQLELEDITISLSLADNLPPITAHNNRLEQVLFNLITNARDAINQRAKTETEPFERTIEIRTMMVGRRVTIFVSDSGIGIPEAARDKIFEPFYTTKEVGKGMGLGLAIIYGILRDYGGKVQVRGTSGRGTTFKLSFPV